jgi:hypothetical protein
MNFSQWNLLSADGTVGLIGYFGNILGTPISHLSFFFLRTTEWYLELPLFQVENVEGSEMAVVFLSVWLLLGLLSVASTKWGR